MSFRSDFFDEIRSMNPALPMSSRESVFINTIDRGLTAQHREMGLIRQEIESSLTEAADRYAAASDDASQTIASEIAYQAEQNRQAAVEISREISWSIEQARVFLGAQVTEVRWAVERNTQVTQSVLDSLWKTHWIDSRQFFDEGVQCYESAEREFARERFQKAAEACRTNGFAYQYLGFLSVHDDDKEQALRYFELAAKFAPNDHHSAIARYHLARAWHAAGNEANALDQIRLAIANAPKDLAYRFELVRALMRAGFRQDAIRELRELISLDLKYWTAAAIDRTLDPMREDVTELLRQLRDEARAKAERVLAEFRESVRLIDSFPQPLPFVFARTRNWQRSVEESVKSMRGKETIFEYRRIVGIIPNSHRALIEEILGGYKGWISDSQQKLADLASTNRAEIAAIRAQVPQLNREAKQVASDLVAQEAQILREKKERGDGYNLALGCTGCLAIPGILIWGGILLEFFAIKRSTGVMDTVGKLILFCPLVLLLPILIAGRSMTFQAKRRSLLTAAHDKQLEIESKMKTVEPAACEAEKRNTELFQSRESEFNALRAIYQDTIAVLEERLAIAKSH